jgi:hypothetical protein
MLNLFFVVFILYELYLYKNGYIDIKLNRLFYTSQEEKILFISSGYANSFEKVILNSEALRTVPRY